MFSGGRATLQAAGNVKLNAHGVPIDGRAGWTVQHAAQACRNLKNNQIQACPKTLRLCEEQKTIMKILTIHRHTPLLCQQKQ